MSTSSDGPADPADPADPTRPSGSTPGDSTPFPPPPVISSPALPPVERAFPSATEPPLHPSLRPSAQPSAQPSLSPSLTPSPDEPGDGDPPPASSAPIGARNGDLTPRWRYVLAAAWAIAFFAYAAIWQASVQIGIGTWWIGPRAQPTHTLVRVLPSLLTISIAMCAIYNVPRLVRLSAMGVLLATILAVPDFSRSIGLGVAELVIAGLLGLVTAAALSGRYRLVADPSGVRTGDAADPPHAGALDGTPGRANGSTGDSGGADDGGDDGGDGGDGDAAMAVFAPPDQTGS